MPGPRRIGPVMLALTLLIGAVLLGTSAAPAAAHPADASGVNAYDGVLLTPDGVRVDHVEEVGELATIGQISLADTDRDGVLSSAERANWAGPRCANALQRVRVTVGGRQVVLGLSVRSPPSAQLVTNLGGIPRLRLECALQSPPLSLRTGARADVTVDVTPLPDPGRRELALDGDGVRVERSTVPPLSTSDRLKSPLVHSTTSKMIDVRSARASVVVDPTATRATQNPGAGESSAGGPLTRLTRAVEARLADPVGWTLVVLLTGAFLLGATHSVGPGHGKTVIAAVAIARGGAGSTRRQALDAVVLGGSVTAAHTASVLIVGAILSIAGASLPRWLLSVLAIVSGVAVVVFGVAMLRGRGLGLAHTGHGHDASETCSDAGPGRRLLVGFGVASCVSPSPSALLLLLGATAAGHPLVGTAAVLAFGIGMAAALAAVGLLASGTRLGVDRFRLIPARARALVPRIAGIGVVGGGGLLIGRGLLGVFPV